MIKGRRKIVKEMDFIANELIDKCLVGRSRAVYEGINFAAIMVPRDRTRGLKKIVNMVR